MAGHVVTVRKGLHKIILETGRDPQTGRRTRRKITFRGTRKQAEEELVRLEHQELTGTLPQSGSTTLGSYLCDWIESYGALSLRRTTYENYKIIVNKHLVPGLGKLRLDQIRATHINKYMAKKLTSGRRDGKGGLSRRSVEYHFTILRQALQHAVDEGLLSVNPADRATPPKPEKPQTKVLDADNVHELAAKMREERHQDRGLILTAVWTGLRRGELLALRWTDVRLDTKPAYFLVQKSLSRPAGVGFIIGDTKSGSGRRRVPISREVVAVIRWIRLIQRHYRRVLGDQYQDNDLVFCRHDGRPLDPSQVSHRFSTLAARAGFPGLRFHDLRHTHATILLKMRVPPRVVQDRMGHASMSVTMDTYSHVTPDLQDEVVDDLSQTLGRHRSGTKTRKAAP